MREDQISVFQDENQYMEMLNSAAKRRTMKTIGLEE